MTSRNAVTSKYDSDIYKCKRMCRNVRFDAIGIVQNVCYYYMNKWRMDITNIQISVPSNLCYAWFGLRCEFWKKKWPVYQSIKWLGPKYTLCRLCARTQSMFWKACSYAWCVLRVRDWKWLPNIGSQILRYVGLNLCPAI